MRQKAKDGEWAAGAEQVDANSRCSGCTGRPSQKVSRDLACGLVFENWDEI